MTKKYFKDNTSRNEKEMRDNLVRFLKSTPIPDHELHLNLGLFLNSQACARILFMHEIYQLILPVHGSVMEFGVRWGQNLALFSEFRALYEPFNFNRKIIGFDTFAGFIESGDEDGLHEAGKYGVTSGYKDYLEGILRLHNDDNPIPNIKKFELVPGDATERLPEYLKNNEHTIVALAYFDFDLYRPTKECLKLILDVMPKGGVIGFDELNCKEFPGETTAVKEVLGLRNIQLRRSINSRVNSYIVIE